MLTLTVALEQEESAPVITRLYYSHTQGRLQKFRALERNIKMGPYFFSKTISTITNVCLNITI